MMCTSSHVGETGEKQGKEEIEDDQVTHQDSGHEVGDAGLARHKDTIPHGLDPLSTQHSEHNHKTETKTFQYLKK